MAPSRPSPAPRTRQGSSKSSSSAITLVLGFLIGCVVCTTVILNVNFAGAPEPSPALGVHSMADCVNMKQAASAIVANDAEKQAPQRVDAPSDPSTLDGVKILVAIAAFDFAQLPHLEEVLDAYLDMCVAGAKVDVVIHATVPYPVTLIDLLNSRLTCTNPSPRADFTVTIVLKTKNLRLHLVDEHRPLFYENINDYDLFIYSEDDIRVTPKTVGAYMYETERVKQLVGPERASDFNVGVARYGTRLMLCFLSLVVLACLLAYSSYAVLQYRIQLSSRDFN